MAQQRAGGGPEPGQQAEPGVHREPRLRDERRRDRWAVLGEEGEQIGRDRSARQGARGLAANRGIDLAADLAQHQPGLGDVDLVGLGPPLREQIDELAPLRGLPIGPVGGPCQHGRDHIVETHRHGVTAPGGTRKRLLRRVAKWDGTAGPDKGPGRADQAAGRLASQSSHNWASSARGPAVTARNAVSASARCPASASDAPSRMLTRLASSPPF